MGIEKIIEQIKEKLGLDNSESTAPTATTDEKILEQIEADAPLGISIVTTENGKRVISIFVEHTDGNDGIDHPRSGFTMYLRATDDNGTPITEQTIRYNAAFLLQEMKKNPTVAFTDEAKKIRSDFYNRFIEKPTQSKTARSRRSRS